MPHRFSPVPALLLFVAALLLASTPAAAQVEHVPITNPVYDYLERMHVRGLLPSYSRAVLPMDRGAVTGFLRDLAAQRDGFSGAEQALYERYADEFIAEADGTQRPVLLFSPSSTERGPLRESFGDREKHLYAWANTDRSTTFVMELLGSAEYRAAFEGRARNVWLGEVGGRFRGTIGGHFGYTLQATNGTVAGDTAMARRDPVLRQNFNFGEWGNDYFDFTEATVTAAWDWGSASLGKEKMLVGNGIGSRLLVSTNAPAFDALRLMLHVGSFRYLFLHGFLLSSRDTVEHARPFFASKYLALHRAEADLFGAVRFGVYETVIYSQRAVDVAYLNPINFYKSAEHAGGDRDNPMVGFDLQTLSLPGLELHGAWIIDDVDFSRLGTTWWGNKFVWQAGGVTHALLPNASLALEYTRIEPYVYSHTYMDNEYTHTDECIGATLPPNSDEWFAQLRWWPDARASFALSFQFVRHGRNAYDASGALVKNNGGDIAERFTWKRDSEDAPFLAGPREEQRILTAGLRWEAVRNVVLDFTYRYRLTRTPASCIDADDHLLSLLLDIAY